MINSDINDIAKVARDVKLELQEQGREAMKYGNKEVFMQLVAMEAGVSKLMDAIDKKFRY